MCSRNWLVTPLNQTESENVTLVAFNARMCHVHICPPWVWNCSGVSERAICSRLHLSKLASWGQHWNENWHMLCHLPLSAPQKIKNKRSKYVKEGQRISSWPKIEKIPTNGQQNHQRFLSFLFVIVTDSCGLERQRRMPAVGSEQCAEANKIQHVVEDAFV